jgi:hypothetical protein
MAKGVGYHGGEAGDNKKVGMGCADVFGAARVCYLRMIPARRDRLQPRTMKSRRADAALSAGSELRPEKTEKMKIQEFSSPLTVRPP